MNKLIRRLLLLVVLSLLAGPLAAATAATLKIDSYYGDGLGLRSVAVNNPNAPLNQRLVKRCDFTKTSPTCTVTIPAGVPVVQLVVTPNPGFVASGGAGLCASTSGASFQFAVGNGGACNIFAGYPLTVTAEAPGVVSAQTGVGANCPITQSGKDKSCQLPVVPGRLTLTIGLSKGAGISGGTGLCTGATAAPFVIDVPAKGPYACGIKSAPPSPLPANGWWWTKYNPPIHFDTGIRYALQVDSATHALYGIVSTFRDDGTPVWYVINATANAQNQSFEGTASEFSNLSGSDKPGTPRLQAIVANVKLTFASPGLGTLVWTPRTGGAAVTNTIERFPIGTMVQGRDPLAPVPGLYNPTQNPNGPGFFLEMQGPGTPHGYIGLYTYTGKGLATWSFTPITGQTVTPFPSKAGQKGWQLSSQMLSYSGGAPITSKPKQPKTDMASKIVATMGPANNAVKLGTGKQMPLSPNTGWGLSTSPYWLQIVNRWPTIKTPYVTYYPLTAKAANFSYVNKTTGQLATFPPFTSIPLSSVANGALLAPATNVKGVLYISDKGLQVGSTATKPKSSCTAVTPRNNAAPSAVAASDCNLDTRWQPLELGGDYDVTYINLFSIALAFNQGSVSHGNTTPKQVQDLQLALCKLSDGKAVVPKGSTCKSGTSLIRVIGPASAVPATDNLLADYPTFNAYIASAFNPKTGAPVTPIHISNSYSGNTPVLLPPPPTTICTANNNAAFKAQNYSASSIKYLGNRLTITGFGDVVKDFTISVMMPLPKPPAGCGNPTGPASCYSAVVTPADFSAALYTAVLSYSVSPLNGSKAACTPGQVESNGANDVFSLVVRDLLVGFASGFVNSSVKSPIPGKTYGTMTSAQWSSSATKIFAGVQPGAQPSKPYYNPWGAAVFDAFGNNSVYGFQYSDYFSSPTLGNPLMPVQPSIPIQLVIQNGG